MSTFFGEPYPGYFDKLKSLVHAPAVHVYQHPRLPRKLSPAERLANALLYGDEDGDPISAVAWTKAAQAERNTEMAHALDALIYGVGVAKR